MQNISHNRFASSENVTADCAEAVQHGPTSNIRFEFGNNGERHGPALETSFGDFQLPDLIASLIKKCPVIWDANNKSFYVTDIRDVWMPVSESNMWRHISVKYLGRPFTRGEAGLFSQLIQEYLTVDLACPLAGYFSGVYTFNRKRVLVTESPELIKPTPGDDDLIENLLAQVLGDYQHAHFNAWCLLTDEAFRKGIRSNAPCVVLVGPRDSCKSRIQHWLITPLCGNRHIDCYSSITTGDKFTAHLFHYEHLMIEDKAFEKDYWHVNRLGTFMKCIAANDTEFYQRKYGTPLNLPSFRRLSVSCNNGEENVRILPSFDRSMLDKVCLYYCQQVKLPWDTRTLEGRRKFAEAWFKCLPHWIFNRQREGIAEELTADGKTGLIPYQSKRVLDLITEASPEHELYELIVMLFKKQRKYKTFRANDGIWEGSSAELQGQISDELPEMRSQLSKLASHSSQFGGLLGKLYMRDKDHKTLSRVNPQNKKRYTIDIESFIQGDFLHSKR